MTFLSKCASTLGVQVSDVLLIDQGLLTLQTQHYMKNYMVDLPNVSLKMASIKASFKFSGFKQNAAEEKRAWPY